MGDVTSINPRTDFTLGEDEGTERGTLVDTRMFLRATRESGYRNVESALSELIDNALQADARNIDVGLIRPKGAIDSCVWVLDDGCGMKPAELAKALQFGGSSRFNDRSGIGRFGMGLPNSSVSQAKRVDIYTWREEGIVWHTYLDLDETLASHSTEVPAPHTMHLPTSFEGKASPTGTLVLWQKIDRIAIGTWRQLSERVNRRLGQRFRYFLWAGRRICINDKQVIPFDPVYLSSETRVPTVKAIGYGEPSQYSVEVPGLDGVPVRSTIQVRFSELPVQTLAGISNDEKRLFGISNGAGVSIVRAGREIDYGWFFIDKRRENYDDWWRCEISFAPELDELFGVNHTKQGIRPSDGLTSWLSRDVSATARLLNHRVRRAFADRAIGQRRRVAENQASERDVFLRPLLRQSTGTDIPSDVVSAGVRYRLEAEEIDDRTFYRAEWRDGEAALVLNRNHDLYVQLLQPLIGFHEPISTIDTTRLKTGVKLLLLALGRTELLNWSEDERTLIRRFITEWSRATSVFLGGP